MTEQQQLATALVVDDSSVMRAMIIRALGLAGLPIGRVIEAEDGRAALQRVATEHVDLVLVDLNMPVMGGEEFLVALRANPATARIPAVVISSDGSPGRPRRLLELRAAFVRKPFTTETLADTVATILDSSHAVA
jgi:two-component system chemotaxis response regulator CheY